MVDWNCCDFQIAAGQTGDGERLLGHNLLKTDRRFNMIGYPCEVRPGIVVEEVTTNHAHDLFSAVDGYWLGMDSENILNEKRQGRRVIHMGVTDQHVANLPLLVDGQGAGDGAGIDDNLPVYEKRGHAAVGAVPAKAPQNPKIHVWSIPDQGGRAAVP